MQLESTPSGATAQVRCALAVLAFPEAPRYSSAVAVNPATDLGRSRIRQRRSSAQDTIAGAFFAPVIPCYGGCAWDTFGCAGFLCPRSANPRTAVTLPRLAASGDGSIDRGASPMRLPSPSSSKSHAAAWRARALSALRSNSSLSVRLARYNVAMERARALEAQGGAK